MKKIRKIAAVLICVLLLAGMIPAGISASQSCTDNFSTEYTYSTDGGTMTANIAKAQNGKTAAELGYTGSWNFDFLADCALLAGQEAAIPRAEDNNDFYLKLKAAGAEDGSGSPGDIAFIKNALGNILEVMLVTGSGGDSTEGNCGGKVSAVSYTASIAMTPGAAGFEILRPAYAPHVHTEVSSEITTLPTCTDKGERTFYCICGAVAGTEPVNEIGHEYVNHEAQAPTCTEIGWDAYQTCSRCTYSTYDEKPALDHKWEEGFTVDILPTLKTEGEKSHHCTRCSERKDVTVMGKLRTFADVKESDYFYDSVYWAAERDIVMGMSETEFSPQLNCTRGQIVTFLWRAAGEPEPTKADNPFEDVKEDDFFFKAMLWAAEKGIAKGMTEKTFEPGRECTRGQAVAFIQRAKNAGAGAGPVSSAVGRFADVKPGAYYEEAVAWAAENGIAKGMTDNTFEPDGKCTRAQIVTFLYRAYK